MADSRIVTIHKKIAELIGVNYAGGHSGVDFTDRVIRAVEVDPVMVPMASVKFVDSLEEFGKTLGNYYAKAIFEIYIYQNGSDPISRSDQSLNVCSDMIKALTANRTLGLGGSIVEDVICDFMHLEGDAFGVDGVGIGFIRVSTTYQTPDGS